jgi:pimeloyl-ACP methyl ester carboxylesterase
MVYCPSAQWYEMLQKRSCNQGIEKGFQVCSWRWRGFLIQYSKLGDEGPAVVLIHGFGAFWEHYRDNMRGLAEKGNRVWGLTMVGFGRSEKPSIAYTELLLAELVRDFIIDVIREPVVLAGNSIGGMVSCILLSREGNLRSREGGGHKENKQEFVLVHFLGACSATK